MNMDGPQSTGAAPDSSFPAPFYRHSRVGGKPQRGARQPVIADLIRNPQRGDTSR